MSWRNKIATVLLLVLIGLPAGVTVCAMACKVGSTPPSHHASGQTCDESAQQSSAPLVSNVSRHDCATHDAAIRSVATTAAERADLSAKSAPSTPGTTHTEFVVLVGTASVADRTAPPGTAPPTTTPLVLRV